MRLPVSRREFLGAVASTAACVVSGAGCSPQGATAGKDTLRVGVVGVGNRGARNIEELFAEKSPAQLVALCDVDDNNLSLAASRYPDAFRCQNHHDLVARSDVDAVLVATADHTHAWVTLAALRAGKHVYCEKPLAHSLEEVRLVTETASKLRLVTQLGTQTHDRQNYREVVALVRSGVIGTVSEVHIFVQQAWFSKSPPRSAAGPPPQLHYDLWLGAAQPRPYSPDYVPASWRRWWAFGEGTLGDMGCHYMDIAFGALHLDKPNLVRAEGPPSDAERCPPWLIVHYDFPVGPDRPPVKLHWYDGGKRPSALIEKLKLKNCNDGVLFVGSEGSLISNLDSHALLPAEKFSGFSPPPPRMAPSPGHHHEWVRACLKGDPAGALCNFEYGGPLSEAVLLGCLSHRTGKPIEWDSEKMQAIKVPEAADFIRLTYRSGVKL